MSVSRSILVVEDEPLIAMMLEDFLLSLGHAVIGPCDSVAEAMLKIDEGGFDMIVMGTHGHSAIGNVVMGSTATRVLARTKKPVLLIR